MPAGPSMRTSFIGTVVTAIVAVSALASAQAAPAPPSTSAAMAKELVSLMQDKKLEVFAARESLESPHFFAALNVPGVQLLVISATYERTTDINYRLFTKDYMGAYQDLRAGVIAKDKVLIEDALGDGLVAVPAKGAMQHDVVTIGTEKHQFDGDFVPPNKKNPKKISQDDYFKLYTDTDAKYAQMLTILLENLKKAS
jgi:hypothetical protein